MITTVRDHLEQVAAACESLDEPLLVDTPTTRNAGAVETVRPMRRESGEHFVVLVVSSDTPTEETT